MNAQIVLGLGFGDEGKGITTDFLCSRFPNSLVVRFSGGQQAGHCVMINGVKHVHSNFGSGTLRGVPSYFTEHCSVYLNTMIRELDALSSKNVTPSLSIHPLTKLTTPYDVAYNRLSEEKLQHGSCGLGIGSTMKRHLTTGYKLFAIDLRCPKILRRKLDNIYKYYHSIISIADRPRFNEIAYRELPLFDSLIDNPVFNIIGYEFFGKFKNLIFEGSQGILLDMDHGIFPNVTYANTTSKNALEICDMIGVIPEIYYVTRCYQTRHGYGWMSNEGGIDLINNSDEINILNEWQKNFRIGEIDYDLINYSMLVDKLYSNGSKSNLVITCIDQRPDFVFDFSKIKSKIGKFFTSSSPDSATIFETINEPKLKCYSKAE